MVICLLCTLTVIWIFQYNPLKHSDGVKSAIFYLEIY